MTTSQKQCARQAARPPVGFTLIELLVIIAMLAVLWAVLVPALSVTRTTSATFQCKNNLRQLTTAWKQWSDENNGRLLFCGETSAVVGRPTWMTGRMDFTGAASDWDINRDIAVSPLWTFVGRSPMVFRCPADKSTVPAPGARRPRVRSYSMSHAFGRGEWLDKPPSSSQAVWRTFARASDIGLPSNTFVFMDVHPDALNDSAFKNACTGAEPDSPPASAQIIDYPTRLHDGAANLSFADGRADTHRWMGAKIRNAPVNYADGMRLNVPAETSWVDVQWLAANTTIKR